MAEQSRALRSFGRRRGRKLSARQQDLHRLALDRLGIDLARGIGDPRKLFPAGVETVWLEIGFGGGEHLVWQARHNPRVGLIGAEPFVDGLVKAADAVTSERLTNVRLHADDVRPLLDTLPDACLDRVFALFPDPWPKRRQAKRRLVNTALLDGLARVMRKGGELRFASDIADYVRSALLAVCRHDAFDWPARQPGDWRVRPPDWPETRYERKALLAGRRCTYLRFRRR